LLNRRETGSAIGLLQDLIRQFPGTPWEGRASLVLGKHYVEQGDPLAAPYLLNVPVRLPLLGDYAQYYLGEALAKRNDANGAATAFDILVQRYPDSVLRPQALYRAVEVWFQAEDCLRVKERHGRFLAEYPTHALFPAALLRQGDCQYRLRETTLAVATFRRIWTQYASSPQAGEAASRLQRLRESGVALPDLTAQDWWLRARTLFDAGQYAPAAAAIEEVLGFSQGGPDREATRLKLGIARVRLKQYQEARAALAELVRTRTGTASQEAVVWFARVLLRQNQDDQLLALAREVEGGLLAGEFKTRFLMLLAAQHVDRGRFDKAIHVYRQVSEGTNQEGLAAEASWRAGWWLYKSGRYDEAVRSFDHVPSVQPGGPYTNAALYWKARSLEKMGESKKAVAVAESLCGEAPNSYYCLSARLRAGWGGVVGLNGTAKGVPGAPIEVPAPRADVVSEDAHYQRAVELRLLGWIRETSEELAMLTGRLGGDRGGVLWLAGMMDAAGDYHRALTLTKMFFPEVIDRGGAEVSQAFWELAYPGGYLPVITGWLNTRRPDPFLVAAVIREESVYNSAAVSSAGALGLMQIMPQTGQQVASRLGLEGHTRDRLFEPCYNIRLGSSYLGHLYEKFDQDLILTIAAYNAGPEAVSKWVQQIGGGDTDEFIESIPYTETRQYVKKVIRSYWEYKRIHSGNVKSSLLDKPC
jgi:soluble lytic murein transglycosylase